MQEVQEILKLLNTYGFSFLISAIALFFAFRYINHHFEILLKKTPGKKHEDQPDRYSIQCHSIFSTLDYILNIGINRLFFSNRFKQILFNDFLTVMFRTMKEHIKGCIENTDVNKKDQKQLESYLSKCLTEMILGIEKNVVKELNRHFSEYPKGIDPAQMLLNKYNQQFESHNQILFECVKEFSMTNALSSNEQRVAAVLYALKTMTLLTMLDAERIFASMDGEFQGWSYKGIKNHSYSIHQGGTEDVCL